MMMVSVLLTDEDPHMLAAYRWLEQQEVLPVSLLKLKVALRFAVGAAVLEDWHDDSSAAEDAQSHRRETEPSVSE